LAEYQEGEDGTKNVTRGILKNFTDENYKLARTAGESTVGDILTQLTSTKFPDFEAFKAARAKALADLPSQLQGNVAYPELSQGLFKGLEDLSSKVGLEFGLSATEKEKEQLLMEENRKSIEQQKRSAELQESLMHSQQFQGNVEMERKLLAEQNEKQAREWKSRTDLDSKLRQEQIAAEFQNGFEERAKVLKSELAESTNQSMQMMLQMQRESREQQEKLTLLLLEHSQKPQPQPQPVETRRPGLLTSLLAPVTNLVGSLLGSVL